MRTDGKAKLISALYMFVAHAPKSHRSEITGYSVGCDCYRLWGGGRKIMLAITF